MPAGWYAYDVATIRTEDVRPEWRPLLTELRNRLGDDWPTQGDLEPWFDADGEPFLGHDDVEYFFGEAGVPWAFKSHADPIEVWTVGQDGPKEDRPWQPIGDPAND